MAKLHSVSDLPKEIKKKDFKLYKRVLNISELNSTKEVFKIRDSFIVGVDYANNTWSINRIKKEIEEEIIFVKI